MDDKMELSEEELLKISQEIQTLDLKINDLTVDIYDLFEKMAKKGTFSEEYEKEYEALRNEQRLLEDKKAVLQKRYSDIVKAQK